jgi:hypothetical protein
VFERSERQIVPGPDLYGAVARIQEGLFRDGQVLLQQVSPTSWVGKGPVVGLGFLMKVTLVAYPMPSGAFAFDAKIEAELEDMGDHLARRELVRVLPDRGDPVLFGLEGRIEPPAFAVLEHLGVRLRGAAGARPAPRALPLIGRADSGAALDRSGLTRAA